MKKLFTAGQILVAMHPSRQECTFKCKSEKMFVAEIPRESLFGFAWVSNGHSMENFHSGTILFNVWSWAGLSGWRVGVKGSGKWGGKGEECAAGGTEWFDSDCFAVLAQSLLDVYKHCSESFCRDLMAHGVKCVFLPGSLVPRLVSQGQKLVVLLQIPGYAFGSCS